MRSKLREWAGGGSAGGSGAAGLLAQAAHKISASIAAPEEGIR